MATDRTAATMLLAVLQPGMRSDLKLLRGGDEAEYFAFLERSLESSLFLIGNVERAGLEYHGQPYQGTYVAHRADGVITAVAGHAWNGVMMLQGDLGLEQAARRALELSGRPLNGLVGPLDIARRARLALGASERPTAADEPENLYALTLAELVVPPLLSRAGIELRRPTAAELDGVLTEFRINYHVEALGAEAGPALAQQAREEVRGLARDERAWLLLDHGRPVAFTGFNTRTRGVAQVGGVWTPPELRGRGYARAAVAGSLLAERAAGTTRSVLFTGRANSAAIRAYRALGFETIGEFALVLFR
jgi:ribosomal protein S18 acetylase RimI-like enzyme